MKQEEPEVPNKDPKGFQTLKLSAQSSPSVAPEAQKPAVVTGPLTPKAKQMPVRRGDVPKKHRYLPSPRTLLVGPLLCHQDPVPALDRGSRQHRQAAWWSPLNRLAIRRRSNFGVTVHSKLRHDCRSVNTRLGSRVRKSWT